MTDDLHGPGTGRAAGKALRKEVPRSSLGQWTRAPDRPDPIEQITEQNR